MITIDKEPRALALVHALEESGLRITPQRIWVCQELCRREDHPTAQQIHATLHSQYPSLSLTTVYQTLDRLVALGVITSIGRIGDEAEHYDAQNGPHGHIVCRTCQRIRDYFSPAIAEVERDLSSQCPGPLDGGRIMYFTSCLEHKTPEQCPWSRNET